ncbi:MAG: ABC transporter ATP-binding protein [Candidatus Krumholzibacteriales bacterium]
MLEIRQLSKRLGEFSLRDISLELTGGEYFVLLGASGVGKSVLLETVAGIHSPDSGRIRLSGRDITREKIQNRGTGMVFQNGALFPHLSVRENIAYGLRCEGVEKAERELRIKELAIKTGLEQLLERMPGTLSGGEIQRTALARALAKDPECLLLDEPISSLDKGARSEIRALLREIRDERTAVLHVTHDYEEALALADRIGVMENGTIAQTGTPREVFTRPRSEFVADFIGIRNFFKGELLDRGGGLKEFRTGGVSFNVLTDQKPGRGNIIIRSTDITISADKVSTSARNSFRGRVTDCFPARPGIEVVMDAGVELAVIVTGQSFENLNIRRGSVLFASIKASAIKFMRAEP